MDPATQKVMAAQVVYLAVIDTVKEEGRAPLGVLYAAVCGMVDYSLFMELVGVMVEQGHVRREGMELVAP